MAIERFARRIAYGLLVSLVMMTASPARNNGAFTKALVDGVELGTALAFDRNEIKTVLLEAYLEARVGELTDHAQTPVMQLPPQVTDLIFAVAKKKP